MLGHLILNKLKFWNVDNSDKVNINSKDYLAMPKQIRIQDNFYCEFLTEANIGGYKPKIDNKTLYDVVGVTEDAYFFVGYAYDQYGTKPDVRLSLDPYSSNSLVGLVPKKYVTEEIWGG